jgi:hypothetical protein
MSKDQTQSFTKVCTLAIPGSDDVMKQVGIQESWKRRGKATALDGGTAVITIRYFLNYKSMESEGGHIDGLNHIWSIGSKLLK